MTTPAKENLSIQKMLTEYLRQLEDLGVKEFYWKPLDRVVKKGSVPQLKVSVKKGPPSTLSLEEKVQRLEELSRQVSVCTACGLHQSRTQTVFGKGNPAAELVLVGEAPGYDEDKQGEPFVGKAGQLLTKILAAMHLEREQVYICNVIKCRPPENRAPDIQEINTCEPFLIEQLNIIQPRVICAMGRFAAQTLLKTTTSISRLRGNWHTYQGIPLMPTFHPAYLLRNPADKALVWEDMQQIMALLEIPL